MAAATTGTPVLTATPVPTGMLGPTAIPAIPAIPVATAATGETAVSGMTAETATGVTTAAIAMAVRTVPFPGTTPEAVAPGAAVSVPAGRGARIARVGRIV
jgi:hypothetical protein